MLTRLLETAANAADAAQSGSNGPDLTQLTNILDWFMIVLLPAVALYLFYTVFRLRRDRVLFDNKLLYPGGCTKDDCLDPDGFIDYILPPPADHQRGKPARLPGRQAAECRESVNLQGKSRGMWKMNTEE